MGSEIRAKTCAFQALKGVRQRNRYRLGDLTTRSATSCKRRNTRLTGLPVESGPDERGALRGFRGHGFRGRGVVGADGGLQPGLAFRAAGGGRGRGPARGHAGRSRPAARCPAPRGPGRAGCCGSAPPATSAGPVRAVRRAAPTGSRSWRPFSPLLGERGSTEGRTLVRPGVSALPSPVFTRHSVNRTYTSLTECTLGGGLRALRRACGPRSSGTGRRRRPRRSRRSWPPGSRPSRAGRRRRRSG
jgi:hypothetical protein